MKFFKLSLIVFLMFFIYGCKDKKIDQECRIEATIGIEIDGTNLFVEVANDVDVFSLAQKISVSKNSTWNLYADILGENELILMNMSLNEGWNKAYIVVWSSDKQHFTQYTLNVYRLQECSYTFLDNKNIYETGKVIERNTIEAPVANPTKEGYQFSGWLVDDSLVDFPYLINEDTEFMPKWVANTFELVFDANGGTGSMENQIFKTDEPQMLKANQFTRTGYTFMGWSRTRTNDVEFFDGDSYTIKNSNDCILYAIWGIEVKFETFGGTEVEPMVGKPGSPLTITAPVKSGFEFAGWYVDENLYISYLVDYFPFANLKLYAKWIKTIEFVFVGEKGTEYLVPTKINDSESVLVNGGFEMAVTETTYELWYEVRIWAESNGYFFQNKGKEGNSGIVSALPTNKRLEPVTDISWRDIIVWCNAYSEYKGLNPVYRTVGGVIIKDARNNNASVVDSAIQTFNNGYRLPTSNEWEMASRWCNESRDGLIELGGRFWTPGDYASGATSNFSDELATSLVAWYAKNASGTHEVALKKANDLGLYDMSGNVWELCFDWFTGYEGTYRNMRGGSYRLYDGYHDMQLGVVTNSPLDYHGSHIGFRLVKNG